MIDDTCPVCMNAISHLINLFILILFSFKLFAKNIRHVFVVSGCPELFVFGHKTLSMRNTEEKQDHSTSSWRNKEMLWKQSSVQRSLTFDCFMEHGKPQYESNMLPATQCSTPEDWSPRWHRCDKLQPRRSFLYLYCLTPSVNSMD